MSMPTFSQTKLDIAFTIHFLHIRLCDISHNERDTRLKFNF
jgi:hypothetical protein